MAIRPTNKEVLCSAQVTHEHLASYEKVKRLQVDGHSCLSCTYFDVGPLSGTTTCRNPRKIPKKARVKHYNICHLHSAVPKN